MPRHSARPLADDRFLAREAGAWTKDKLYYVERYAKTFTTAMAAKRQSAKWSELVYLDLLCGPGRCVIRSPREIVDGSPLRALKVRPEFDRFSFADADETNIDALSKRIPAGQAGKVTLQVGDCNVIVRDVVKRLSPKGLALAFLDPEGFEVHFDTLAALSTRRIDIVYLFPSGIGIKRAMPHFLRRPVKRWIASGVETNGAVCRVLGTMASPHRKSAPGSSASGLEPFSSASMTSWACCPTRGHR
jgi:three-Cys-motif partner protein